MITNGSVVWIKSGSPKMTVKSKTFDGLWLCSWFVNNELKENSFSEQQLTVEEPKEFN